MRDLGNEHIARVEGERSRLNDRVARRDAEIAAKDADIARLREVLHFIKRTSEMSAEIMLDTHRTGGWAGAQGTANAFCRISNRAAQALEAKP